MFEKKYIFRLNEKITRDEALEIVGNKFYHDGIVTAGFVKALQQREKDFPTGMILEKGTNIAISHTDDKYVIKDRIAIIIADNPVIFKSIENGKNDIKCNIFFIMALTKENKNEILSAMADLFENYEDILKKFSVMTDEDILDILL